MKIEELVTAERRMVALKALQARLNKRWSEGKWEKSEASQEAYNKISVEISKQICGLGRFLNSTLDVELFAKHVDRKD